VRRRVIGDSRWPGDPRCCASEADAAAHDGGGSPTLTLAASSAAQAYRGACSSSPTSASGEALT
jgi:hypothetical protein